MDGRCSIPGRRKGIFLYVAESRSALGPTQPPIQWVLRVLFLTINGPMRESDRSPPSIAQVENGGVIPALPHTSSWIGVQLIN
jgi:hypothetical protein